MDQVSTRTICLESPTARVTDIATPGVAAAMISTRVRCGADGPLSLKWEVCAEGERDPMRYGLCLARPENDFRVDVPVFGLKPGQRYSFEFQLDGQVGATGQFQTRAQASASHLAA